MRFSTVIFDFDFTLADSAAGSLECVGYALSEMGFNPPGSSEILKTVGKSLADTFVDLTEDRSPEAIERFSELFLLRADEKMADSIKLFPNTAHVLEGLYRSGYQLALLSGKIRRRLELILNRDHIRHYFKIIVGADDCPYHKPDPGGLLYLADKLKVSPCKCVYVGDHLIDGEAANAAGMTFLAITTGQHQAQEFSQLHCLAVISSLTELSEVLIDGS